MHISNPALIVILFVGLVAGWLAGRVVRGTGFGIIGDIVVGFAGALVASFLFPRLGIHIGTGLVPGDGLFGHPAPGWCGWFTMRRRRRSEPFGLSPFAAGGFVHTLQGLYFIKSMKFRTCARAPSG